MKDLISVIVPVYKVEKYINQCIDSIINQTYTNLEIILVDDGSPDNCGNICDEYAKKDKRIKVIHKENEGVSIARNIGLENSNGKYVTFIDSDDWVDEEYCKTLFESLKKQEADCAACGYNRVTGETVEKINSDNSEKLYNSKEYLIKILNPQTGLGFCHMKLYKKEILSGIEFEKNIVVGEDALFNIKISKKIKKAAFVSRTLYNYRINSESVVKKYDKDYAKKYLTSMEVIKRYIEEEYKEDKEVLQNYYNFVAFHVLLIAVNYCFHPKNDEKNKIRLLKYVCNINEFKIAIKKSNYNNISITRKITLFTLKHKLYYFTKLICIIRNKQNKKEEKIND